MGPIHYFPIHNGWLVLNYDDVSSVVKQTDLYSSAPQVTFDRQLSGADAPDHARLRRILTPFFTRAHLPERSERIRKLTAEFITPLRERPSFDIMSDLAQPLTHAITCDWLGLDPVLAARVKPEGPLAAWDELIAMRKGDGVFSALLEDGTITRAELLELMPFLLKAGITTVRDFTGLAIYSLLRNPEFIDKARADPAIIPALVEELLRYESPVITLMRRTRTAVTLAGQAIPADSLIYACIGAANRDPEKFSRPDELVLNRPLPRLLSFSIGPHHCLGNLFGRVECEIILTNLLVGLPRFRSLIPLDQVEFDKLGMVLRSLRSLPLGFVSPA
jgi:cytochrome P450